MNGTAAICGGSFPLRRVARCPVEGRRRRIAGYDLGAWCGAVWTCCGCGDSWGDGELLARPFRPGWRSQAVVAAKRTWDEAGGYTREDHWRWLEEQL